jgi:hypothetical protein
LNGCILRNEDYHPFLFFCNISNQKNYEKIYYF